MRMIRTTRVLCQLAGIVVLCVGSALPIAAQNVAGQNVCASLRGTAQRNLSIMGNCDLVNVNLKGNVAVSNGTLKLMGSMVRGNISQAGTGAVIIRGDAKSKPSRVMGNITESGNGSLIITGGSVVFGDISEGGSGRVLLDHRSHVIRGNIAEDGPGDLTLRRGSGAHLNISEGDSGNVSILEGSFVLQNVLEANTGRCNIPPPLNMSVLGNYNCSP